MFISKAYAASETVTQTVTGTATETAQHAGDAAHGAAEHGASTGGGAFPPFDPTYFASQIFWLAVTFAVFYWLMKQVAIPRISSILEVRRDRIQQDLDEAQRMKDEADAAHDAYEHELSQARARAQKIAADARDKAKVEADAERARVDAALSEKLAIAEASIGQIRAKALSQVGSIATETADAIVRQLTGAAPTKAEIGTAIASATGE